MKKQNIYPKNQNQKQNTLKNSKNLKQKHLTKFLFLGIFAIIAASIITYSYAATPAHANARGLRGQVAIDELGATLPEVAARHGFSAAQLRKQFLADNTLETDGNGNLLYVENTPDEILASSTFTDAPASAYALSDTFNLHSLASASRKIYLDFNGHTTSGTGWNRSYTSGADIVSIPFDSDNTPGVFSDYERQQIQNIWAKVADDYAPYQVDVTTEDPGVEGLIKSSTSDVAYGVRVVASTTNYWYPTGGGVAYITSFSYNSDTPAFIFPNKLQYNDRAMAEAVAHEVGHTLGLNHDGQSTTAYYQGHGDWAPIMGIGYYRSITQFSKGEYADSNNTEDDLSIIQKHVPLKTDDKGSSTASATALSINSSIASDGGIISTAADLDYFSFNASGSIALTVTPTSPIGFLAPNLDLKIRLLNSAGGVVAESDPVGVVAATISTTVPAGNYYLEVNGVGYLTPTTGYSDYGSLGAYTIDGNVNGSVVVNRPPTVSISVNPTSGNYPLTVNHSSVASDPEGSALTYLWNYGDGSTSVNPSGSHVYNTAGIFPITLTVTDSGGLSATANANITVNVPTNKTDIRFGVSSVLMSKTTSKRQKYAQSSVKVVDQNGLPLVGVVVVGNWSGLYNATVSANTDSNGVAFFKSAAIRSTGTETFTVTNASKASTITNNFVWDNIQKSGSISL